MYSYDHNLIVLSKYFQSRLENGIEPYPIVVSVNKIVPVNDDRVLPITF
jgi:hypothetical protein